VPQNPPKQVTENFNKISW